ncbi:PREDICTED: HERV-H LTR-associating protein 3 [Rhinopithecus bieti]|uniref:HERV-H LTR-associating protein 3 n=1 Tax=Rhinopithecus bieti TaxID=61621 RepID=UPI00083C79FB|nr:PREDICTED: HERV-H LTR-associating protein 3 [Rhinopithecus bieti]
MFGARYKQPLKPSGSAPTAVKECRMTPRHAGCGVTEKHGILVQSTFTEHLLRAIHRASKYVEHQS